MKILYKEGDVCEAVEDIIAHGCNAQGKMGSGVAKAIRAKFPEAYDAYIEEDELELGTVIAAFSNDKIIANCITQEFYGNDGRLYVDYDAIRQCMRELHAILMEPKGFGEPNLTVAMPMIGAGLAGGDWAIIEKIIEEEFTDVEPVVYVFK